MSTTTTTITAHITATVTVECIHELTPATCATCTPPASAPRAARTTGRSSRSTVEREDASATTKKERHMRGQELVRAAALARGLTCSIPAFGKPLLINGWNVHVKTTLNEDTWVFRHTPEETLSKWEARDVAFIACVTLTTADVQIYSTEDVSAHWYVSPGNRWTDVKRPEVNGIPSAWELLSA